MAVFGRTFRHAGRVARHLPRTRQPQKLRNKHLAHAFEQISGLSRRHRPRSCPLRSRPICLRLPAPVSQVCCAAIHGLGPCCKDVVARGRIERPSVVKRKTTRTRRAISAQPELHRGRRPSPRRSRFYRPGLCGKGGRCHAKHRWWTPPDSNQNLGAHTPAPYHFGQAPIFHPPNPPEHPPPVILRRSRRISSTSPSIVILSQRRRISSTVPPDTPGKTKPPYFFTSIGINCCI